MCGRPLFEFHARLFRQFPEGLGEVASFDLLIEAEDVAARPAREAVPDALIGRHEETRMRVIVKWTQADEIPSFLCELAVLSNELLNRQPHLDLGDGIHGGGE